MEEQGIKNDAFEAEASFSPTFLSVKKPSVAGHTYVYEPGRSLQGLTVDTLPTAEHYRKLSRMYVDQRPTMEELLMQEKIVKADEEAAATQAAKPADKAAMKLGWMEGVLMICLLSIWGVMLFLRLSWVIGQTGIIQGLLIITLCNSVTLVTGLSMSAVATNGQIAGGGVYYMISRALGPEFGGGIGLMFTIGTTISVASTTLGFCDNVFDLVYDVTSFKGIVASKEDRLNDLRIIGTPVLVLLLVLAIVGMKWVTRVQKLLLVLLLIAQIDMFAGTFVTGDSAYVKSDLRHAKGFTGWSIETAKKNLYEEYLTNSNGNMENFISVFGVFFGAVTGITAGANLSGDLKDPASAIPKGTLLAIIITYLSYAFFGIMVGFNFLRQCSGNVEEYLYQNGTFPAVDDCSEEANAMRVNLGLTETSCNYGSAIDQKVMMYISGTGYLVYMGCYGATLSSAIASLEGAPRVLQAVAKDKIFPKLYFFAKGKGPNNSPFRGYLLVFVGAFGCLMIGDLNTIGKLASNFYLAAYGLMNFSVFHSSMTKSPGWRPSFKFYNPWVSLLGAFVCFGLMFALEWKIAIATVTIIAVLYGFILYLKPDISWGSSAEALVFVNALNNSHALNEQQEHVKTYRPKILLLSGNPAHRQPLVDFANLITKKMSLLICSHIIIDDVMVETSTLKENVEHWLKDHEIRSFYSVCRSKSFSEGVSYSIMLSGLGKLGPNMVMMGYKHPTDNLADLDEYYNVLVSLFENKMSVGILRLSNGSDYSSKISLEDTTLENILKKEKRHNVKVSKKSRKISTIYRGTDGKLLPKDIVDEIQQFRMKRRAGFIDVWWLYDDGGLTLLLPYILQTRKQFADCKLRVFSLSNRPEDYDKETRNLATLLAKFRIDFSEVFIVPDITKKALPETKAEFESILSSFPSTVSNADLSLYAERTNRHLRTAELLREHSANSELVVLTLPLPRKGLPPTLYLAWLEIMTKGMPPTLITRGNQASVLTYYS